MKINKLAYAFSLFLFTANSVFAQTCDCSAAFKWAKKAFEENDAGFQYIIDQKGNEAYHLHNRVSLKRIKKIINSDSCVIAVKQWAKFFRVGHFGFIVNTQPSLTNTSANTTKSFSQYSIHIQDYDSSTVYLRIPTFSSNHTKEIDSVINLNSVRLAVKKT